ncbi:uncharacterized protein At1g66480-like isoform X1 [Pistacia vera]|uniref:uncharacterized protein At1g66480-like isoform X1 n=1 Tax=Pistacia vera TaxID=55513 RepID=UPI001263B346|nr:uncharacterized protein At1g66480-like isoform X1 [Pistacia vera]
MGNTIGGRKKAKVMKVDGETFKLKTPVQVSDVVKDYPGHVLLDSEAVKHYGIRAKPLEPQQILKAKKIYFLVELPKFIPEEKNKMPTRRVQSGIHMGAKDRLELLMLSRRAVSDLSAVKPSTSRGSDGQVPELNDGRMRVKMRLPKSQVAKLMDESKDEAEAAEKLVDLYVGKAGGAPLPGEEWKPRLGSVRENHKAREKHVSFFPAEEIQLDVTSR